MRLRPSYIRIRKFLRWTAISVVSIVLAGTMGLLCIYVAVQRVPSFYREALAADLEREKAAGQDFERQTLALHNQSRHAGAWEARFTQDEINGWLATDLPAKFPLLLPRGVSEPRIAIAPRQVQAAARYQRGDVQTVISLVGELYLTEEPNEFALRIDKLRAGALPVPLDQLRSDIAARAAESDYSVRWTEDNGRPVAIVKLSLDSDKPDADQLVLERLELGDKVLVIGGRTEKHEPPALALESRTPTDHAPASPPDNDTRQR